MNSKFTIHEMELGDKRKMLQKVVAKQFYDRNLTERFDSSIWSFKEITLVTTHSLSVFMRIDRKNQFLCFDLVQWLLRHSILFSSYILSHQVFRYRQRLILIKKKKQQQKFEHCLIHWHPICLTRQEVSAVC